MTKLIDADTYLKKSALTTKRGAEVVDFKPSAPLTNRLLMQNPCATGCSLEQSMTAMLTGILSITNISKKKEERKNEQGFYFGSSDLPETVHGIG